MRPFEYASPTTVEQAVSLLGGTWGETEPLAGGTDLISLMKDDIVSPRLVVSLRAIPELKGISIAPRSGLRIGALATVQELLDDPAVGEGYAALTQAADGITSPQIRNLGTVGGDICQRPRCWYYRAGYGLLALDETGKPLVPEGDNRYHAILGNEGPAYFVSPSSLAPALIAFQAKVSIVGPAGPRLLPIEQFFVTPKTPTERERGLKPNEIVTELIVPPAAGIRSATYEVREHESLDWPLAAASVALKVSGGKVRSARIVLGHVAPVPWRAIQAERAIVGKPVSEATALLAGDAAVAQARSLGRNGYKIQLARVAVKRAILRATQGGTQ